MRVVRALPEVVRTYAKDTVRRRELLQLLTSGERGQDLIAEFGVLDAERSAFERMCRGSAPLAPLALGFEWGEQLLHPGCESPATVREDDLVEFEGALMTLLEASRILATRGIRTALGAWSGRAGRIGVLAQLEPVVDSPLITEAERAATSEPPAETQGKTAPPVGGNYDLFG